jgi:hypothetical protein
MIGSMVGFTVVVAKGALTVGAGASAAGIRGANDRRVCLNCFTFGLKTTLFCESLRVGGGGLTEFIGMCNQIGEVDFFVFQSLFLDRS